MFEKNLNSTSRLMRFIVGICLTILSLIAFSPKYYLLLFIIGLIGFLNILNALTGWSAIYAMTDQSDFPSHLNRFSKQEMLKALK